MLYRVYQLIVSSELPLPELLEVSSSEQAEGLDGPCVPDVVVRRGSVPHGGLQDIVPDAKQLGPFLWAGSNTLWLQVPTVARFLISDGRTITLDTEPGVDEDSLRVFLLGSAFGALLFQRGQLVLHGNAVRVGQQAMICVGPSGCGKSTLAAGFMQRGHQVLADDVVPIDAEGRAMPGLARIKLWQDSATHLKIDTAELRRIRPTLQKFHLPLSHADSPTGQALPARWIYVLDSDDGDSVRVEPILGLKRFAPLHANTYRVRYLEGMALKPEHLRRCTQLAGRVRLARVVRPRVSFDLEALMDALSADMAAHP